MNQEEILRLAAATGLPVHNPNSALDILEFAAALQPSWQPIELAPKDGTEVIVGVDVASVWIARNARFVRAEEWMHREPEDTDGWWAYKNSVSQEQLEGIYEPTHFLPMPDPS